MKYNCSVKRVSIGLTAIWLILFALIPISLVCFASFLEYDQIHLVRLHFTLENYQQLVNSLYLNPLLKSLMVATICTLLCLLLGYPFAYYVGRSQSRYKNLFLLMVIIPLWTNSLIRSYAIMAIIKTKGLLNSLLLSLGIIDHPLQLLFTNTAVIIGLIYNLLPFMILPLITNIERLDSRLIDAAHDLGASKTATFIKVILPLTIPGILSGSILVFLPAMTLFYIPDLLGGAKSLLLGNVIENQFMTIGNWPLGSAISILLTLILLVFMIVYWFNNKDDEQKNLL